MTLIPGLRAVPGVVGSFMKEKNSDRSLGASGSGLEGGESYGRSLAEEDLLSLFLLGVKACFVRATVALP